MPTPAALLADLVKRFRPEAAEGLNATYQLHLTGDDGDYWHLTIANQECSLGSGPATDADVAISMNMEDWSQLVAGRLDPVSAFLSGRVRVSGDFSLATRLAALFAL
jgi:putative sterol carrier protein